MNMRNEVTVMDINILIERVTEEVMKILAACKPKITIISNKKEEVIEDILKQHFDITESDSDYILISRDKYDELINTKSVQINNITIDNFIDFTSKKVITERDLKLIDFRNIKNIKIKKATIITALAKDILKSSGVNIESL